MKRSKHPFDVDGGEVKAFKRGGYIVLRSEPALLANFDGNPMLCNSFRQDFRYFGAHGGRVLGRNESCEVSQPKTLSQVSSSDYNPFRRWLRSVHVPAL